MPLENSLAVAGPLVAGRLSRLGVGGRQRTEKPNPHCGRASGLSAFQRCLTQSVTMAPRTAVVASLLLVALAALTAAPVEALGSSKNVKALTDRQYTAAVRLTGALLGIACGVRRCNTKG